MKKIIHVNRHNIAANKKAGNSDQPVFTVKTYKTNDRGNRVALVDNKGNKLGEFVYQPDKPLPCGAVAWFETRQGVRVELLDGTEIVAGAIPLIDAGDA